MISLSEKVVEGKSLIDKILKEDVIRKTSVCKECSLVRDNRRNYYFYSVDMDSFVHDFEVRKLQTFIKENQCEYGDCDILYSSALYPEDGEVLADLMEKLNSFSKGDKDEEDTNS